jgi:hypothetical protein
VKHYAAAIGVLRSFGAPYTSKTKRVVSKPVTMACRNSAAQRRAARPAPCGRLELAGTRRQAGVDGADRETEALLRMSGSNSVTSPITPRHLDGFATECGLPAVRNLKMNLC